MFDKVLTGKLVFNSLKPCDLSACTKSDIKAYFENTYDVYESLFTSLNDDSVFYKCPDRLRLPLIFYYGHTAAVYVNKMVLGRLIKPEQRINLHLETLFETGVDEMSWDDVESYRMGPKFHWPKLDEVIEYRRQVRKLIMDVIDDCTVQLPITVDSALWPVFMGFEHDRIHLETSSVLIRQLPVDMVHIPPGWNYGPVQSNGGNGMLKNSMIRVETSQVMLGKPIDFPSYGWDNEYGQLQLSVPSFEAAKFPTTNGEFLEFVTDGGYNRREVWSDEGWQWVQYRQAVHPTFWICTEGCKSGCGGDLATYSHCHSSSHQLANGHANNKPYRLRRMFDVIDMPWSWPVEVNYHEAKAYCAWKGSEYRLMAEAEHQAICGPMPDPNIGVKADVIFHDTINANLNLQFGSSTPVNYYEANSLGFHDVRGNVWQWLEDHFNGLPGFKTSYLYDDFSTPCFDGRHTCIAGGSWVSTGDEASRFARFAFRRHFFQHLGFRVVRSISPPDNGHKLQLPIRLVTTPVFVLGAGIQENEFPVNKLKFSCLSVSSTNTQYTSETDQILSESLNSEYRLQDDHQPEVETVVSQLHARCQHWISLYLSPTSRQRALHMGCATGRLTFELCHMFNQVVGQDIYGRFIDSAIRLQRGETVTYNINGTTDSVTLDDTVNKKNVIFKQFTWLPNELGFFELIVWTQPHRLQNTKAWFKRLREMLRVNGLLIVVEDVKHSTNLFQLITENFQVVMEEDITGAPSTTLHCSVWRHVNI